MSKAKRRTAEAPRPSQEELQARIWKAQREVINASWAHKNATVNDVLEELCGDMHTTKNILEGMSVSIYETNIEGSGCLTEQEQTKIMLGIHHTLELLVTFIGERLERSADVYTDQLPARKKEERA